MRPGDLLKISERYLNSESAGFFHTGVVGSECLNKERDLRLFTVSISDMFFISESLEFSGTGELFFKIIGSTISIWVADFELHYIFEVVKDG